MANQIKEVVIVGAGPTGLTLALLLAKRAVKVHVLESLEQVDQRPRGVAYGTPAVRVLGRAGVLDEIRAQTFDVRNMSWRDINGQYLAGLEGLAENQNPDRFCLFPVHKLSNLLMEHVQNQPLISVHFSHKVVGANQDTNGAWVEVEANGKTTTFRGDYVIGCDGAASAVRRALYGDDYPGFTWQKQLIATNVRYNVDQFKWSDLQWIVDPEHWGVVCRLEDGGIWRIAYGEELGYSNEELRERLAKKFEEFLPGRPNPEEYEVLRFSPFVMHQRCVEKMRKGKILLCGDAAHLCNPMGGLGLTGGLSDIGSLVDCFYGLIDGRTDESILDKWDEVRRKIYNEYISPLSTKNLERLFKDPCEVKANDPFFKLMDQATKDPNVAKDLQMQEMIIGHDMTQYFAKK